MKFSADMGHGYSKFFDGAKLFKIEAVLGETHGDLMGVKNRMEIKTEEGNWYIGKTALQQSTNHIYGRDEGWAFTPEYRALLLYGISEAMGSQAKSATIDMVTGLPVADFRRNREEIASKLKGVHSVERPNSPRQTITIRNIAFLPQGFAPAKPYLHKDRKITTLDLGSRNIGYATFDGSTLIDSQTDSKEIGATLVLTNISKLIEKRTKRELSIPQVVEVLNSKTVRAFNQDHDVSDIVDEQIAYYLRSVETLISQVWGNAADIDQLVVFGGAALLIGEQIEAKFPNQVVLLDDPQYATVKAQYDFAKRKFK